MMEKSIKEMTRLDLGEAWAWCKDCNAKLYSFDGNRDVTLSCPTREECKRIDYKLNPQNQYFGKGGTKI